MIDHEKIIGCAEKPLTDFCRRMRSDIGDWEPFLRISEKILAGEEVSRDAVQPEMRFLVDWCNLIMDETRHGQWNWNSPDEQAIYQQYAESKMYRIFADALVGIVVNILKTGQIGSVVEIGSGPGKMTEVLCQEMKTNNISIPFILSDGAPGIKNVGNSMRERFPELTIFDFVWDITQDPPEMLIEKLTPPVLVYERFCIPYGGYASIDRIAPIADVLILLEDFNLTDRKDAYDIIFEKIGLQFFTCQETRKHLDKHFKFINALNTDRAANIPDTCFFMLASDNRKKNLSGRFQ